MTTGVLLDELKEEEGCRFRAYPDPLSDRAKFGTGSGNPWTIGYGHTGPEVSEGVTWTQAQCDTALEADLAKAELLLDVHAPWWRAQDDVRQDVLADMVFNMGWGDGVHGLSGFHHFLNFVRTGQYEAATDEMLLSRWATQVGKRASRLSAMMRSGSRQPAP